MLFASQYPKSSMSARLTAIRNRKGDKVNDKLYTPYAIAKRMVELLEFDEHKKVMDPCQGGGAYLQPLP